MTLGARLAEARQQKGESQLAASEALGIHRLTYRLWERDAMQPGYEYVRRIADYCGVPVGVILQDVGVLDDAETAVLIDFASRAEAKRSRPNYTTADNAKAKPKRSRRSAAADSDGKTWCAQTVPDQRKLVATAR